MYKIGETVPCGYCQKPLVIKNPMQKYHLDCSTLVSREQDREYRRLYKTKKYDKVQS